MNKIWFSIAMTFNTSLFVWLIILLVLPNAKYVSTKRMSTHKNNSGDNSGNGFMHRFLRTTTKKIISTTPKITTEEEPDILDYEEEDNEDEEETDVNLKADVSTFETTSLNFNSNTSDDYDLTMNPAEKLATEPPEMESLAELVDENGQVEKVDEDETEESDSNDTTTQRTTMTTTRSVTISPSTGNRSTTPKVKKFAEYIRVDNYIKGLNYSLSDFDVTSKLYQIYQQKVLEKNMTEMAKKKLCLEYSQDSGFWCAGVVSKLEIRYFYQKETQSCECFLYYGCFGNKNNFESIKECEDNCKQYGLKKSNTPPKNDCAIVP